MVEVDGTVNVKVNLTIKEAVEALYKECIVSGKNETDKTDDRTKKIFESIDCLRKSLEFTTINDIFNKIKVDGILSTGTNMNSYSSTTYVDGTKVLYQLRISFNELFQEGIINSAEVKSALEYLEKNYNNYVKGINNNQKQETYPADTMLGKLNFPNYWEFLEIPINSPLITIKEAYSLKYDEIESSLINGENEYTPKSLIVLNQALRILTSPSLRYVYNCVIEGKKPDNNERINAIEAVKNEMDYDFELNQKLASQMFVKLLGYKTSTDKILDGMVKIDKRTLNELIRTLGDNYSELVMIIEEQKKTIRLEKKQ